MSEPRKGRHQPGDLLAMVADLLQNASAQATAHQKQSAPVWVPRNGMDSQGVPFIVVTCTECLRSFPISVAIEGTAEIQETSCLFCPNTVRFIVDFSLGITSPEKKKPSEFDPRILRSSATG